MATTVDIRCQICSMVSYVALGSAPVTGLSAASAKHCALISSTGICSDPSVSTMACPMSCLQILSRH